MTDQKEDPQGLVLGDMSEGVGLETSIPDESFGVGEAEGAPGHAQAWQEDSAGPEDDFHDHDASGSEDESDEGEPDEEEEDAPTAEEEALAQAKRRGRLVMVGVLGVGALVIGGLAYSQFFASSASGPLSVVEAMHTKGEGGNKDDISKAAASVMENSGLSGDVDISTIYNAGASRTTSPGAQSGGATPRLLPDGSDGTKRTNGTIGDIVATAPDGGSSALPAAAPAPQAAVPAQGAASALPSQPTAVPTTGSLPGKNLPVSLGQPLQPASASSQPTPAHASVQPLPVQTPAQTASAQGTQAAASPQLEGRISALAAQLDALKKTLDQAVAQTGQLASRLDSGAVGKPDMSALEARLAKLEQKMSAAPAVAPAPVSAHAVSKPQAALPKTEPVTGALSESEGVAVASPQEDKPALQSSTKASKRAVHNADKRKAKKAAKPARHAASASSTGGMVLRAATPEAAWVAPDRTSSELRRVAVGETLPGIGKVKSIKQSGDQWEIVGTKGTLR